MLRKEVEIDKMFISLGKSIGNAVSAAYYNRILCFTIATYVNISLLLQVLLVLMYYILV